MKEYIRQNEKRFLDELFEELRIPSVSSSAAHRGDMEKCARKIADLLLAAGADTAEVCETAGNPVVFGEKKFDPKAKTVMVYGHYDVMPEVPRELWNTDPFEPVIKDGAIYARGANDDKGQHFMHIKVLEYLVREGKLRHNIKFLIEGEEEIGSKSLSPWIKANKKKLACDVILVSDTTMISDKVPSLNTGMRGLQLFEITVKGPDKDVHSGHFGGAIVNPVNALCNLISTMTDGRGRVTIDGFYDDVADLPRAERRMIARAPFDMEEFKESLGIDAVMGEKGYTTLERIGIRPSFDLNGIWGGYMGEGAKTIIPSEAHAKVSMRLVPNQAAAKIAKLFEKHVRKYAPKGVKVTIKNLEGGESFSTPLQSSAFRAASRAMAEVYGVEPVPSRGGGSITVIADAQKELKATPVLMGFGLERDLIHSPNESFLLDQWRKGMESIALFYKYF